MNTPKLTKNELALLNPFLHIPIYSLVAFNNVAWRIESSEFYAPMIIM